MFGFGKSKPSGLVAPRPAERKDWPRHGAPFTRAGSSAYLLAGQSFGGQREATGLARAGFLANPVGFRAVRMIAEAAAALPLLAQDCHHRYDTHPMLQLLARPNETQSRAEFLEAVYGHLLLHGNAYIEAGSDAGGQVTQLHVFRPDRVQVLVGRDGWPEGYEYRLGRIQRRYTLGAGNGLCHIRSFHPQDDHYGLSPLQSAGVAIDVHNAASQWSRALLDNSARPSGAIVYKGEGQDVLSAEQYDRLIAEIESFHQGAKNAGRPLLLEGGLDWKPMGFSPSDMEFHQTKLAAAREIAMAFGVAPMLLGIPGDATYANYQEAHRAFYRLTVLPLGARVLTALSYWLAGFHSPSEAAPDPVEIRLDLDQIPALAAEREAQWQRVGAASFLTNAEKRQALGLPPLAEAP